MNENNIGAKAGQTWRMRNGETIVIEKIDPDNGDFPILVDKSSWMASGRYWAEGYEHSKDLVEKVKDAPL